MQPPTDSPVTAIREVSRPCSAPCSRTHRQRTGGPRGPDDPGADRAPLARVHVDPLLVDLGTGHAQVALQAEQKVTALLRGDLVDPRVRVRGLAQLLRRGFEVGGDRRR
ncbi:hypothetical protein GCM10010504_17860 [Streptomyces griseus]|nr:hypothetical protein GCM10010504_17860 [Streptomyces griseus]